MSMNSRNKREAQKKKLLRKSFHRQHTLRNPKNDFYLYMDESGNTGTQLNDEQDTLYYCSLLSRKPLHKNIIDFKKISSAYGESVTALHGRKLGLTGLEKISNSLLPVFKRDFRLLIAYIDKFHHANLKFFDLIFDAGLNKASSGLMYNFKALNMISRCKLTRYLTRDASRVFNKAFFDRDYPKLSELCCALHDCIAENEEDFRMRELMCDSLKWASNHIEDLMPIGDMKGDTPNLTALGMTMHELNTISNNNFRILEFIHDQQGEFAPSIEETQRIMRTVKAHWGNLSMPDMARIERPVIAKVTFGNHQDYEGLQLADIMLMLFKKRNSLAGGCLKLFEEMKNKIDEIYMNPEQMIRDAESYVRELNNLPLSEESLRKGVALRDEFENARKKRIAEDLQIKSIPLDMDE